ncbi:MAG: hypothetical protein KTR15_08490 [Phycisphaeraceae bacterium]|nr:hypothetical protein [Phycisphaeraceae bacterium]
MIASSLTTVAGDGYYKDPHGVFSTRPSTDTPLVQVKPTMIETRRVPDGLA